MRKSEYEFKVWLLLGVVFFFVIKQQIPKGAGGNLPRYS